MPPSPQKPLSPAELAKLEHAFATDPQSEAYRPLAEAYLGMGRFMEAMVVCKKGVKAHPNAPDPRVLLARVYAEQGKEKKALEELAGALQVAPKDKAALRLTGALQMKGGEAEPGKSNLLKAYELDPNDADTLDLLKQHGVALPAKEAPPPPVIQQPVVAAPPPSSNGASARSAPTNGSSGPPVLTPAAAQPHAPAAAHHAPEPVAAKPKRPKTAPPKRPAYSPDEGQSGTFEVSRYREKKGGSAQLTVALLVVAVVGGGGFAIWRNIRAKANKEANAHLRAAAAELKHDSFDSYKKAITEAEGALEARDDSVAAHGILAYAHAIRWGEHGGGDEERKGAEEHLAAGLKTGDRSVWLYAAEALIPYYSGNSKEGLKKLAERIEQTGGRSAQLYLTQAIIQMNDGDLDGARESVEKAQQIQQDDARIYSTFGTLNRRRGLDREAMQNYDTATRFEKNHADSMLGTATLVLDQDNPAMGYVSAAKILKNVTESQPPASPRQQALALVLKSLLISRVSNDLPLYTDANFQKQLEDGTGVGRDKDKNKAAALQAETAGFNLDKSNPELLLIKGKRLFFEGNLDGAAAEMRKAIEMNTARVHFHIELAKVLMAKEGGEKDAEAALRKALTAVPDNPKLRTLLGQVLYKQKRMDDAISELEKALKPARESGSKQRNPDGFYGLGRIYDEKKDVAKAIDAYTMCASQAFSNATLGSRCSDAAAMLLDAKGDKGAARGNFEKALNSDSENDAAICHYVKFLQRGADAKDKDRIKELAKKYVEVAPRGECVGDMRAAM
jgi:cellulose synthase operon protein C